MKIVRYKQINKGAIVGNFDLEIPQWKFFIRGMTLFKKNGRRWVNMPSEKFEADGEVKYAQHCRFIDKETNEKFSAAVMKAIDEYCWLHSQEEIQNNSNEDVPF